MIPIDEAVNIVLANLPAGRVEAVPFQAAQGRILAEDLAAPMDVPPFNRSAMDGYAVMAADTADAPVELAYAGEIKAGGGSPGTLGYGRAMAIMTGAPVPQGADAVQMVEQTQPSAEGTKIRILKSVKPGENITPLGSEAAAGDVVLTSGRFVGPAETAVMAGFGFRRVKVWRRPSVALLATGDELVEADQLPRWSQIRNSNTHSLSAQLGSMGLEPEYLGIAGDDKSELRLRIGEGLERDVLILTGGVSMGEYDYVKDVFRELGIQILFSKVAMKPGKPTVFARRGDRLVFGLPGNPVSTFVAFENIVRPALGRICGHRRPELPRVRGELLRDMTQVPGRTAFLPAWVHTDDDRWKVDPFPWKGSGDIIGFSRANATVIFPADRHLMKRGETVEAMLFPDFFSRQPAHGR